MFRTPEFEIKRSKDDQEYFVLRARNGKIILVSEMYKSRASVYKGIESVRVNSKRKGAFVKTQDKTGEYRFTLRAANNKVVGQSQGYNSRWGRLIGIASVKLNAPRAVIVED